MWCVRIKAVPGRENHILDALERRHGLALPGLISLFSKKASLGKIHLLVDAKSVRWGVKGLTGHTGVLYVTYQGGTLPLVGNLTLLWEKPEPCIQIKIRTALMSGAEKRFHEDNSKWFLSPADILPKKGKVKLDFTGLVSQVR